MKNSYSNDMKKSYKSNGSYDAGCVKQASEEKMQMLGNGGGKYSYNNAKELKQKADALAKVVK